MEDLVIAVIASGGDDCDTLASGGLVAEALGIYLSHLGETVCSTTFDALVVRGLVRRDDEDLLGWPFRGCKPEPPKIPPGNVIGDISVVTAIRHCLPYAFFPIWVPIPGQVSLVPGNICLATTPPMVAFRSPRNFRRFRLTPPFRLMLAADGRRLYARDVVPRLGLRPPATVLAPIEPERLPFDNLGLDPTLADNLRYRWEEAGRCAGARAWLAATVLYVSILEVWFYRTGWDGTLSEPTRHVRRRRTGSRGCCRWRTCHLRR